MQTIYAIWWPVLCLMKRKLPNAVYIRINCSPSEFINLIYWLGVVVVVVVVVVVGDGFVGVVCDVFIGVE